MAARGGGLSGGDKESELKKRMELFLSPSAVSTDEASEVGNLSIISGRSRRVHTFDVSDTSHRHSMVKVD